MTDKKKIALFAISFLTFTMCLCDNVWADAPNVLTTLGTRTETFAIYLRSFAFIISGFGIIMFTWAAIFGKINFRHLGYIMISLFFLSGVGLLISYMTGGDAMDPSKGSLSFGNLWRVSHAVEKAGVGELDSRTSLGK